MSAREKREAIGVILMILGIVLIVVGAIVSYSEWSSLPIEKLALMAIVEAMGWGIGMTAGGFILFGIGLGVFFASSNAQAWRRAKGMLPI